MTRRRKRVWALPSPRRPAPIKADTATRDLIVRTCDAFIRDVLKPRFLPEIRPTEFNYCIDIQGSWRAGRYTFAQRYRVGPHSESFGQEFAEPFVRLDLMGPDRFDIFWHRHTGEWRRLHSGQSLAQALRTIEADGLLHPL